MKQKYAILLAICTFVFVFAGCAGKNTDDYTVKSDYTVGDVEWGESMSSVKAALGKDAEERSDNLSDYLTVSNVKFYGQDAKIEYMFDKGKDENYFLNAITIFFTGDFDKDTVVEDISDTLGEREKNYPSESGEGIAVPEEHWFWQNVSPENASEKGGRITAAFWTDLDCDLPVLEIDASDKNIADGRLQKLQ